MMTPRDLPDTGVSAALALAEQGRMLNDAGRYTDAVPLLRRAIAAAPEDSAPHRHLAWSLMQLHQLAEALAEAERAIVLDPTHAFGYRNRALILMDLNRRPEAIASAREAVRLAPQEPVVFHTLARAQLDSRKIADAVGTINQLRELAPEWYFTHETEALLAWHRRDWSAMQASAEVALRIDPEAGTAMYYLAISQLNRNRNEDAIQSLYQAARLDPRNRHVQQELRRLVERHTSGGMIFLAALLFAITGSAVVTRIAPTADPLFLSLVSELAVVAGLVGMLVLSRQRMRRLSPPIRRYLEEERGRENRRLAQGLRWLAAWIGSLLASLVSLALWSDYHRAIKPVPWILPVLTVAGAAGCCACIAGMLRTVRRERG